MTLGKAKTTLRLWRSVPLILLLVVAGGLFAWWMVAQSEHEMRDSLLQQARTVAQAVNRDQVKSLTGTAADLDQPNYQRLKEQVTDVRLSIPQCRLIYLLGRQQGGTVFFFVDSQPTTAKDYSPPGRIYADLPAGFRRGFDSRVASVEGPVHDRGGMWISAVVPLLDPRTGAVLAVLCVDVDARDWKWNLASRTGMPVGLVLVLFMGGAAYLFALRRPSAPRTLMAALSLLITGLLITGMVVLYAKANGERRALREFELVGNEFRLDIFARLHAGAQALHSAAALFDALETVTREDWRTFTRGLKLSEILPGIQGLGYASLIPRAQLTAHVAAIRREGFPDYQVRPAGGRETYSPIIFLEPFTNRNLRAFGYDMLTEPVRRAALERARDEHGPALSGKVRLVQETDQDVQAGTLMFVPVYRRGWPVETVAQRRAALQGWVYSPYRMADLLQGALRVSEARFKERQIGIQVYDGEALSADTLLYDNRSAEARAQAATPGIDWLAPVNFAGHRWTLRFVQLRGLAATTEYSSAWVALCGGTVISLLLFGVALSLLTTSATARRMAGQLEQELRLSEASYRNHFVNNASMMLMIDPAEGTIIEANNAASKFYGYPHERLLTLRISDLNTASAEDVRQAMAAAMHGLSNRFEFQHRLADGSLREVEVSSGPFDFGGRTVLHSIIQDVTERKRAGEEIRRQAALIRSLLDSIPDIVFFKNTGGVYLGANPAFAAFVGRPRNEIIGRTDQDLFDRENADSFQEQDKLMLAKRETRRNEEWITYPDGRKVLMDTLKSPYWGPEGELIGLLGIGRDITAQRRAEDALRESEQFAQGAINALPGQLAILDGNGIIITVNRPWREFARANSGNEPTLCEGANYLALCDTVTGRGYVEATSFAAGFRAVIEGRQDQFTLEYACHSPNEKRWFLARVTRFQRGESTYVAVVHDNITQLKQVEIQLRQMTERQTLAARAGGVGIWDYDVVNNRMVWDDQMFGLYGITPDQFSGAYEAWQAGLHPEDRQRGEKEFRMALSGEKDFDTEFRVLWPDGTTHTIRARAQVQRDASGRPTQMIGTNWDITAQKQAAEQLQQTNQSLEMANARANALAEKADAANRAKSDFLANMSHEIRTPMNGVIGMTGLLLKSKLDSRQTEFAEAIGQSAQALLQVIDDVLDLSKVEAGKITIISEEFSLRSVLDGVLEVAGHREPEKGISLAGILHHDAPDRVKGDPQRLRQVLLNLVGNSIKFTREGEVTVRVQPVPGSGDRGVLRFEVKDTGIGMTADQVKALFQRFVQAEETTSRRFGGTGLGLAISHRLVELMGGSIGVESEPDKGSTFWCELPFGPADQLAIESSHPALAKVVLGIKHAGLAESLREQFQSWGVGSTEVGTARELVAEVESAAGGKQTTVVVICEDEFFVTGGANLRHELSRLGENVCCLLLASPANALAQEAEALNPFKRVLLKPVKQSHLFNALVTAVEGRDWQIVTSRVGSTADGADDDRVSSLRILLAEDHPINRKLSLLVLEGMGATTHTAENGLQVLAAVARQDYDVILMDCNMPEMDGYEATQKIRQLEESRGINRENRTWIVALTANALAEDRERCLAGGMDEFLSKPFTTAGLRGALLRRVGAGGAPPVATATGSRLDQLAAELDRESVAMMVEDYIKDLPIRVAELQNDLAEGKREEVERTAHSLKGVSAQYGLEDLSARFSSIEDAAKSGDLQRVREHVKILGANAQAAAATLGQWLEKP